MNSPQSDISILFNLKNSTALIPIDLLSVTGSSSASSQTNSFNYELILPVAFVLGFMLFLFFVYAMNNLEFKNYLRRLCCRIFRRKRNKPYPIVNQVRNSIHSKKQEPFIGNKMNMNNYGKPIINPDINPKNYYEDDNMGFYRIQNPYENSNNHKFFNQIVRKNNNYDQIYTHQLVTAPNSAIINMQGLKLNRLYQSEDKSEDYVIENVENFDQQEKETIPQSQLQRHFFEANNQVSIKKISRSTDNNSGINEKNLASRRSYSHSKLDYQKWQRALTRRQTYSRIHNWPSKVLSEYELKKFLSQSSGASKCRVSNDKQRGSMSLIQQASLMTSSWSQSKSYEQKINRNYKCKSYAGLSKINPVCEHSDEDDGDSNGNYQDEEPTLSLIQPKNKKRNKNASNKRSKNAVSAEFSSILFNSSEINYRHKNVKSVEITNHLRHRSSTFKAIDTLIKQDSSSTKRNSALSRLSSKIKDKSIDKKGFKSLNNKIEFDIETTNKLFASLFANSKPKYSRLCKSFTFFTNLQKVSDINSKHESHPKANHTQTTSKFSSEPSKLSSFSSNSKQSQNNYLKNLSAFEQEIEIESLNLLVKKLENASNLSKLLKNLNKNIEEKSYHDAAVQTSTIIESQNSSFNSHGTTLMQTNCYGSIMANFGSAMIQRSQTDYHTSKKNFLRSHSDGNGLSSPPTKKKTNASDPNNNFGTISASSSKLTHPRFIKS